MTTRKYNTWFPIFAGLLSTALLLGTAALLSAKTEPPKDAPAEESWAKSAADTTGKAAHVAADATEKAAHQVAEQTDKAIESVSKTTEKVVESAKETTGKVVDTAKEVITGEKATDATPPVQAENKTAEGQQQQSINSLLILGGAIVAILLICMLFGCRCCKNNRDT